MARRDTRWNFKSDPSQSPQTGTGQVRPGEGPALGAENPGLPGLFKAARQKGKDATRGRMVVPFRPNLNPVGVDLGQYYDVTKKSDTGSQRKHRGKF